MSTASTASVNSFIDEHADEYIAWLQRLLRQPSVSTQNIGIPETAEMVKEMLESVGVSAQVVEVPGGNPVVYGELKGETPDGSEPKILRFYNHYDVQPAEPLELWHSDPWAAEIRDGRIWARGVSDNKGNLVSRIAAIHAYTTVNGKPPVTIRFIVEGEEEMGSPNLEKFTKEHPELCAADACIWETGGKDAEGRPTLQLGLKGICYVELRVKSIAGDQHSSRATSVPNAAWRLIWALNALKGPDEVVRIPGFYDKVKPPTEAELEALKAMPDNEEKMKEFLGIDSFLLGLTGLDLKIRDYFQPTLTVSGIQSGYTGPGTKTVLPAEAMAKVDMRLCADQDPYEILELLKAHLKNEGFGDVEVTPLSMLYPARTSMEDPFVKLVAETAREVYGKEPVIVPTSAGSGPWYQLNEQFGVPGAAAGAGHAQSAAHAPNENIYVEDYIRAIKQICLIIDRMGANAG